MGQNSKMPGEQTAWQSSGRRKRWGIIQNVSIRLSNSMLYKRGKEILCQLMADNIIQGVEQMKGNLEILKDMLCTCYFTAVHQQSSCFTMSTVTADKVKQIVQAKLI